MNHKQFEFWILDGPELDERQKQDLKEHLAVCPQCRQLEAGWRASEKLLTQTTRKVAPPGFSSRWLVLAEKKKQMEKVRRYRLTLLSLIMLAFMASLTYMVSSGYFLHMLADIFNSASRLLFGLTNGLSAIGSWFYQVPIAVPLTIGFILFGLFNAFILVGIFTLWNLKQRKTQTDEIQTD